MKPEDSPFNSIQNLWQQNTTKQSVISVHKRCVKRSDRRQNEINRWMDGAQAPECQVRVPIVPVPRRSCQYQFMFLLHSKTHCLSVEYTRPLPAPTPAPNRWREWINRFVFWRHQTPKHCALWGVLTFCVDVRNRTRIPIKTLTTERYRRNKLKLISKELTLHAGKDKSTTNNNVTPWSRKHSIFCLALSMIV